MIKTIDLNNNNMKLDYTKLYKEIIDTQYAFHKEFQSKNTTYMDYTTLFCDKHKLLDYMKHSINISPICISPRQILSTYYTFLQKLYYFLEMEYKENNKDMNSVKNILTTTFEQKNNEYGNAFDNFGWIGVYIRLCDKINRLLTLTSRKDQKIKFESINDTYLDALNYILLCNMLLRISIENDIQ